MCYIPPLLSHFSFLRFSVQLERRCSPSRNVFPSSCLVFPRGIRKFLAISYSNKLGKTCHFHVAWTPAILVFSADQYNRGALLVPKCKNVSGVSIVKNVRPLWESGLEKWCWKPDYELHLRKKDGEVACAVIIQLKLQRCHLTGSTKSRNLESGKQNWNPESGNRNPKET